MWVLYAVLAVFFGLVIARWLHQGRVPSKQWGVVYSRAKDPTIFWSTIAVIGLIWLAMLLLMWTGLHASYPTQVPSPPIKPDVSGHAS